MPSANASRDGPITQSRNGGKSGHVSKKNLKETQIFRPERMSPCRRPVSPQVVRTTCYHLVAPARWCRDSIRPGPKKREGGGAWHRLSRNGFGEMRGLRSTRDSGGMAFGGSKSEKKSEKCLARMCQWRVRIGPVWRDDWSEGDRNVAGTFPAQTIHAWHRFGSSLTFPSTIV